MCWFYRKVDQQKNLPPLINRKKEDIKLCIMSHIKNYFKKDEVILFMTSVDGTSVGSARQEVGKAIVGGSKPYHYIPIPDFSADKDKRTKKSKDIL